MFHSYNLFWSLQELLKKRDVMQERRPNVFAQGNIAGSRSQSSGGAATILY